MYLNRYLVRNVYSHSNTDNGLTDTVREQQTESSRFVDEERFILDCL